AAEKQAAKESAAADKQRAAAEKQAAKESAAADKQRKIAEKQAAKASAATEKQARKELAAAEKQRKAAEKQQAKAAQKAEAEATTAAERQRVAEAAASPEEFLKKLGEARSNSNQLVALSDLGKIVEDPLKKPFMAHWTAALEAGSLPAGVGSLAVGAGKTSARKLFLLSDVVPKVATVPGN
ncbi:MAG TPA: hypothetical protein VJV79_03730, partial [Polyangiaceae bacterium]|nr:hypothetical protein [Polyangiaceae bacterium]